MTIGMLYIYNVRNNRLMLWTTVRQSPENLTQATCSVKDKLITGERNHPSPHPPKPADLHDLPKISELPNHPYYPCYVA
jgi:hypothetical protein